MRISHWYYKIEHNLSSVGTCIVTNLYNSHSASHVMNPKNIHI